MWECITAIVDLLALIASYVLYVYAGVIFFTTFKKDKLDRNFCVLLIIWGLVLNISVKMGM